MLVALCAVALNAHAFDPLFFVSEIDGHAHAALAASIFHFGAHSIEQTKRYLAARGVPVRLDVYDQAPEGAAS